MQKMFGTIESLAYEAGTMSAPAFANILVISEGETTEKWAKGRVAKALVNAPKVELILTTQGDEIVAWEAV